MNTLLALYFWLMQILGLSGLGPDRPNHLPHPADLSTASSSEGPPTQRCAGDPTLLISNGF